MITPEDKFRFLEKITGHGKAWFYTHPDYPLTPEENLALEILVKRRESGEPLAYILGEQEFCGLKFFVNQDVLIPRPETEIMVEYVIKNAQPTEIIIDVGTGSGCIAVSIAKKLSNHVLATDVSPQALTIARRNAKRHEVIIDFIESNLLDNISLDHEKKYFICANLPYVDFEEKERLDREVTKFEPHLALFAGEKGVALYFRLIDELQRKLSSYRLIGEITPEQAVILQKRYPTIKFIPDYTDRTRFFVLQS